MNELRTGGILWSSSLGGEYGREAEDGGVVVKKLNTFHVSSSCLKRKPMEEIRHMRHVGEICRCLSMHDLFFFENITETFKSFSQNNF